MNKTLNTRLRREELTVQGLNLLFCLVFCAVFYFLFESQFVLIACIGGALYTIVNTRFFYFMSSAIHQGGFSRTLAILVSVVKLPILLALVYLSFLQGLNFLISALIGLFVFLPTSITYAFCLKD
ncbi:MAG: hypothetical protein R3A13_01475 [Bdellovibrionota bacterium]